MNWTDCSLSLMPPHVSQLHDHITPLLTDLHWLQIPQHIQYSVYWFSLRAWVCTEISTRGYPSGREHWATTLPALCLLGRLDRAGYVTLYTGRPRLCRGRSTCLEHSACCDPAVLITWQFYLRHFKLDFFTLHYIAVPSGVRINSDSLIMLICRSRRI